jgi:FkbM family methyltransferase
MVGEKATILDCRDATREARVARWLWDRSGRWGRKRLRRWTERWLSRHAPVAVPLAGARIVLDGPGTVSRSVFLTASRETEDEAAFQELVQPGMTVLDVGANLGIYTILAAMRVGPAGAVHAFEPVPAVFACLERSIRLSGLGQVRLNQAAVSDRAGTVPMYLGVGKDSDIHSLAPSDRRPDRVDVTTLTLDDYVREHRIDQVQVMKIDVEGAELPALRGATGLLARDDAPIIQAELADDNFQAFGYSSPDLKRFLADLGYTAFKRTGGSSWETSPIEAAHPKWENVLFVKPAGRRFIPASWHFPPAG